jgi:hypothetical protein
VAHHWLVKSEPEVYSIDDLRRDGTTYWEGSGTTRPASTCAKCRSVTPCSSTIRTPILPRWWGRPGRPDGLRRPDRARPALALLRRGRPHDRWSMVDVEFVSKLPNPVSLDRLKKYAEGRARRDGGHPAGLAALRPEGAPAHFEIRETARRRRPIHSSSARRSSRRRRPMRRRRRKAEAEAPPPKRRRPPGCEEEGPAPRRRSRPRRRRRQAPAKAKAARREGRRRKASSAP